MELREKIGWITILALIVSAIAFAYTMGAVRP